MEATRASDDISDQVSKLSLTPRNVPGVAKGRKGLAPKKTEIADDWEDEVGSDEAEALDDPDSKAGTDPPPPTPVSLTHRAKQPPSPISPPTPGQSLSEDGLDTGSSFSTRERTEAPRPEKTDAVARRMIAGALGMKMPKRTEEQKEYDKAMRDKERKRREEERELQRRKDEAAVKAKQAIWDD